MTIEELLLMGNQYVHKDQARLLLGILMDINPLELSLLLDKKIDEDNINKYKKCLMHIKEGKPLQYALNNVSFYGYDFYVDESVLIPRFETEELVENTSKYLKKYFPDNSSVLDLCSGSGCIGITLKKLNPNLEITLSDISSYANRVSLINKEKLNVNIEIIESDLFNNIKKKFDSIISNPPYISYNDELDPLVSKNEPPLALFASNNGLDYYERILKDCENYLNNKYMIAFEIGDKQKDAIIELINKYLINVQVICKKDIAGSDRMIFIFKNINIIE